MKKILAFLLVTAIAIALLPSISAPVLVQVVEIPKQGSAIVNDYCVPDTYPLGTFSIARNQNVTFNIPTTACPPVKKGPILGGAAFNLQIGQFNNIGVDGDFTVVDIPQYQYTCYFKKPCDCIIPPVPINPIGVGDNIQVGICFPRQLKICANISIEQLSVEFFTNTNGDGVPQQFLGQFQTDGQWCAMFDLPPGVVRVDITNNTGSSVQGEVSIFECCCYDCYKEKPLPTTLYPKIDIETFSVSGGPTVIQNGKVISEFQMSPGSQLVLLQVENRGFFTQNDARIRFDGLPEGITVEVAPETQKLTAHNIGTYSANFTVGPNVPSGTYQITMIAYSPNGVFDKITFEFVVP